MRLVSLVSAWPAPPSSYLHELRCQVYHCPYVYAPPFAPGTAKVVTVHDLIPNRCPDMLHRAWKVRLSPLWNFWFKTQCASARAVITVSDFSRQELLEFLHLPQAKVHRIQRRAAEQDDIDCGRRTQTLWFRA